MKNDNKSWLFWFAILMIAFNVILLAYIVVGMNKADIGLSPKSCVGGSWDRATNTCRFGDSSSNTVIALQGSRIRDSDKVLNDDNRLTLVGANNGIKMTGIDENGNQKETNVLINGNITAKKNYSNFQTKMILDSGQLEIEHNSGGLISNALLTDLRLQLFNNYNGFITILSDEIIMSKHYSSLQARYTIDSVKMNSPDGKYWKCAPDNTGNWKCIETI